MEDLPRAETWCPVQSPPRDGPSAMTALRVQLQRSLHSVSQLDDLRGKNKKRIAELNHMNHKLQTHLRGRLFEEQRSLDQAEVNELKKRLFSIIQRQRQQARLSLENEQLRRVLQLKEAELTHRKRAVSVCQRCEDQAQEHKHTVQDMETFYRSKLSEARSALEQKEEQFRSFKDRVAENVLLSSTTENTENMNSPVNRSRLTEMYQQLRVCVWPHINWTQPEHQARDLVQEMFSRAHENMTKALSTVCAGSTSSPQVDTFRRRALENLQVVLLHSSKQEVCQKAFPSLSGPELDLASECYWLGCLMALHSPPLHPHWDRASGLVFPRDIRD